jgi:hypothetical protein
MARVSLGGGGGGRGDKEGLLPPAIPLQHLQSETTTQTQTVSINLDETGDEDDE